jgi:hypothetical protein
MCFYDVILTKFAIFGANFQQISSSQIWKKEKLVFKNLHEQIKKWRCGVMLKGVF